MWRAAVPPAGPGPEGVCARPGGGAGPLPEIPQPRLSRGRRFFPLSVSLSSAFPSPLRRRLAEGSRPTSGAWGGGVKSAHRADPGAGPPGPAAQGPPRLGVISLWVLQPVLCPAHGRGPAGMPPRRAGPARGEQKGPRRVQQPNRDTALCKLCLLPLVSVSEEANLCLGFF